MTPRITEYSKLQQDLLNNYQHGFPLCSQPYAELARQLGVTEQEVIETLQCLQNNRSISRIGPVFRVGSVGCSTLAAMAIPQDQLESIAALVNEFDAVNHNYEREHEFNLWFVATAENETELDKIINDVEYITGYPVMVLPMLEDYHIDLGFELLWS